MESDSQFAFSGRFPVFRGRVVSPLYIASPVEGNPRGIKVKAIWDTGASMSIVTKEVADMLNLPVGDPTEVRGAFNSKCHCANSVARMMIVLGSQSITHSVLISEIHHPDRDCDVVLGLDFITLGDFALTHDDRQLMLSFTYPPVKIPIDYTVLMPQMIPDTITECVEDVDSDGNEKFRRELIIKDYFRK